MMPFKVIPMRTIPAPVSNPSEISITPVRLRWFMEDLATKDGHRMAVGFTCAVAMVDEPAERKLFDEVFTLRGPVTLTAVAGHFLLALRSASSVAGRSETAEYLLEPINRSCWIQVLQ